MNASLLQHNKSFHEGRRGSRASVRGPSRAGSLNSLRTHSPTGSLGTRQNKVSRANIFFYKAFSFIFPPSTEQFFVSGSRNGGTRSRCNSRDESTPDVRSPTRKEKGHSSELETLKDETVFVQRNA